MDLIRIRSGLSRIEGKAADNPIIQDMVALLLEVERLQADLADARVLTPSGGTRYDQGFSDGVRARDEEVAQCRQQLAAVQRLATDWQLKNDSLRAENRRLITRLDAAQPEPATGLASKGEQWWANRATREPDGAMGAGHPCLCHYAIAQTVGEPIKHDRRCMFAEPATSAEGHAEANSGSRFVRFADAASEPATSAAVVRCNCIHKALEHYVDRGRQALGCSQCACREFRMRAD